MMKTHRKVEKRKFPQLDHEKIQKSYTPIIQHYT